MTKKECIEQIRSIERKCRGPLTVDGQDAIAKLQMGKEAAIAAAGEKSGKEKEKLLAKIERLSEEIVQVCARDPRQGCGYDFNETIVENPWDGETREVECPECGIVTCYTAPIFE